MAEKMYYTIDNVGKAKYTVSTHDGVQTHKDGSPFFGINIFKARKKMDKFVKNLIREGYIYKSPIYS